jgi:hypothetical protein
MQRDMELVRRILFELERHPHGHAPPRLDVPGYSGEQIGFHIHLLGQAGLLETADITTHGGGSPAALPLGITWQGYDFLDAARSESVWKKAGAMITKAGLGFSFDLLKPLLIELAKQHIGLSSAGPPV